MSYLFGGTPFDGYGRDGRRSVNMGGGGGGGPTTTTNQTSNIPDWLRPQVEAAIGASTQQLFNTTQNADGTQTLTGLRGYVPYSTNPSDYVAGFSPMQTQSFQSAANLQTPGQFGAASDLSSAAGQGALGTTGAAMGYGGMGANYGAQGAQTGQYALGYGQNASNLGYQAANAGQNYQGMATNPGAVQAYMNPYVQASLAPQLQMLNQQQALQNQNLAKQAVASGAYGGSRQAVAQGLNQQNFDLQRQQAIAQGYNTAFNQAQQAQQFGANLGLQGQQAGIQGQQAALQGVQGALAGTAQGIQGAQAGMQGVQGAQAGYNLANQAGQTLGQLGSAQLAAQQAIINQQNTMGAQQQAQQQNIINNAINNYAMAQNYPQQQLAFYNSMVRGYATPTTSTSQYQAAPSAISQLGGLGATALGAYGASGGFKAAKKGGIMRSGDGLDDIGMYLAMKGKK